MIYTLKAGIMNPAPVIVNKKEGSLTTNGKTFDRETMNEIKSQYKGTNRIHKPIALLFYTDVMNGENVADCYGEKNII